MQKITTFLTFDGRAEEAVAFYTSIFARSKVVSTTHPGGAFFSATFELDGQTFIALNGGPSFRFAEGISLFVSCETQEEIDQLWARLTEGGKEKPCGWLEDKFGVSWQIVPAVLGRLIDDERVVKAMMKMRKLDIAALKVAHAG